MGNTNDATRVMAGKPKIGGAVFRAPLGTPLPTSEAIQLNSAFVGQGYCSEDGLNESIAKAYAAIKAWGGDEVLNSQTDLTIGFEFTLIESTSSDVLKTVFSDSAVTTTPGTTSSSEKIAIAFDGAPLPKSSWSFDIAYGEQIRRIVVPIAQITTEDMTVVYADESAIAYAVKLSVYRDPATGKFFFEYIDTGIKAAA